MVRHADRSASGWPQIDPDLLEPKAFFVLDTHVRKLIASRPAA